MAPWFSYPNVNNPTVDNDNYHQLPDDVRTVIQVYGDDDINDPQISVHDIWEKLPATMQDKGYQLLSSDSCGTYNLNAAHTVPATYNAGGPGTGNNAHDEWATARRIHALADYAFTGSAAAKAVAYPKTTAELSLGHWVGMCGDRPVNPLVASTSAPTLSTCSGKGKGQYIFNYSAAAHCQWSATGNNGSPKCR